MLKTLYRAVVVAVITTSVGGVAVWVSAVTAKPTHEDLARIDAEHRAHVAESRPLIERFLKIETVVQNNWRAHQQALENDEVIIRELRELKQELRIKYSHNQGYVAR